MDPTLNPQVQPPDTQTSQPTVMAQSVVAAASNLTPTQVTPQTPARAKESGPAVSNELAGYVEVVGSDSIEKEPLPPEVSSWMEKVSRDTSGEKPPEVVVANSNMPPTVDPGVSRQVFVLPLGEAELEKGLHQSVKNSVRWLSEWCKRLVKKLGDQTSLS